MKLLILLILMISPFSVSGAMDVRDIDPIEAVFNPQSATVDAARRIVRERNVDWHGKAVRRLKAEGAMYDRSRVEVAGMLSTDDTYQFNPEDFDGQIKPSITADFSAKEKALWMWAGFVGGARTLQLALHTGFDSVQTTAAWRGETTEHVKKALAKFRDIQINELVAHSLGSEIIYAAIMNGEILPPRKLIVIGVPDDNFAKWEMLAARTGTEVHFCRATNDRVAQSGASAEKLLSANVDFKSKWDELCQHNQKSCPTDIRPPQPVIYEKIGKLPDPEGHNREDYYARLKAKHIIDGDVAALRKQESARIESMKKQLQGVALQEAYSEARDLVAQARQQYESERADEDRRGAEMQRCWYDLLNYLERECSPSSSLDMRPLQKACECYTTSARGPWKISAPPALPSPLRCQRDLWRELQKHPDATADELLNIVLSFRERTSTKVYACDGEKGRITSAACAARGYLTEEALAAFYEADACIRDNPVAVPIRPYPSSCAEKLEHSLERGRYSIEEANRQARYYWQAEQPQETPRITPPPAQDFPEPKGPSRKSDDCSDTFGSHTCRAD